MWICKLLVCCEELFGHGTHDLEGVGHNADSHELLSVVATVHHQRVGKTLNDWALCFSESLLCVAAGGVGDVDWGADLNVIAGELVSCVFCRFLLIISCLF